YVKAPVASAPAACLAACGLPVAGPSWATTWLEAFGPPRDYANHVGAELGHDVVGVVPRWAERLLWVLAGPGDVGLHLGQHLPDPVTGHFLRPQCQHQLVAVLLRQCHHPVPPRCSTAIVFRANWVHAGPCSVSSARPDSVRAKNLRPGPLSPARHSAWTRPSA